MRTPDVLIPASEAIDEEHPLYGPQRLLSAYLTGVIKKLRGLQVHSNTEITLQAVVERLNLWTSDRPWHVDVRDMGVSHQDNGFSGTFNLLLSEEFNHTSDRPRNSNKVHVPRGVSLNMLKLENQKPYVGGSCDKLQNLPIDSQPIEEWETCLGKIEIEVPGNHSKFSIANAVDTLGILLGGMGDGNHCVEVYDSPIMNGNTKHLTMTLKRLDRWKKIPGLLKGEEKIMQDRPESEPYDCLTYFFWKSLALRHPDLRFGTKEALQTLYMDDLFTNQFAQELKKGIEDLLEAHVQFIVAVLHPNTTADSHDLTALEVRNFASWFITGVIQCPHEDHSLPRGDEHKELKSYTLGERNPWWVEETGKAKGSGPNEVLDWKKYATSIHFKSWAHFLPAQVSWASFIKKIPLALWQQSLIFSTELRETRTVSRVLGQFAVVDRELFHAENNKHLKKLETAVDHVDHCMTKLVRLIKRRYLFRLFEIFPNLATNLHAEYDCLALKWFNTYFHKDGYEDFVRIINLWLGGNSSYLLNPDGEFRQQGKWAKQFTANHNDIDLVLQAQRTYGRVGQVVVRVPQLPLAYKLEYPENNISTELIQDWLIRYEGEKDKKQRYAKVQETLVENLKQIMDQYTISKEEEIEGFTSHVNYFLTGHSTMPFVVENGELQCIFPGRDLRERSCVTGIIPLPANEVTLRPFTTEITAVEMALALAKPNPKLIDSAWEIIEKTRQHEAVITQELVNELNNELGLDVFMVDGGLNPSVEHSRYIRLWFGRYSTAEAREISFSDFVRISVKRYNTYIYAKARYNEVQSMNYRKRQITFNHNITASSNSNAEHQSAYAPVRRKRDKFRYTTKRYIS